jgi:hypothetical protein
VLYEPSEFFACDAVYVGHPDSRGDDLPLIPSCGNDQVEARSLAEEKLDEGAFKRGRRGVDRQANYEVLQLRCDRRYGTSHEPFNPRDRFCGSGIWKKVDRREMEPPEVCGSSLRRWQRYETESRPGERGTHSRPTRRSCTYILSSRALSCAGVMPISCSGRASMKRWKIGRSAAEQVVRHSRDQCLTRICPF